MRREKQWEGAVNAETFYENFKDALDYLSVSWGDMDSVTVYLNGNKIVFAYGGKSASMTIPVEGK